MTEAINLQEKFALFTEHWTPKIIGDLNDTHLKIARIQGEFVWHQHDDTDELFLVVQGSLIMHFRDKSVTVNAGELIVVPKGVEHKPEAPDECFIMMIEKAGTLNTGDAETDDLTVEALERI